MTINKYIVQMFEQGSDELRMSRHIVASSPEEAIEITRHDRTWYEEGEGPNYRELKFPIVFKAETQADYKRRNNLS